MNNKIASSLLVLTASSLVGCATGSYNKIADKTIETSKVAESSFKSLSLPVRNMPVAAESDRFWVNKTAIMVKDDGLPEMFDKTLQLVFEPKSSLRDVTASLSRSTRMRFSFDPDVQAESDKPLLLAGYSKQTTPKGFLDQITAIPNPALSWQYKDGGVEIFRYRTQVFQLTVPTNDITFNGDISNKNTSSGSGSTGNSVSTGHVVKQSSEMKFWTSIEAEVKQMLTPNTGKVTVAKATGNVTVTDTPQALNAVEKYIKTINYNATRKIFLNIQVMTVQNSSGDNYGVNWGAVYGVLSSKYGLTFNTPIIPSGITTGAGSISAVVSDPSQLGTTATALAAVLTSMGRTTKLSTYPLWTLSGTPTHASVTKDTGYVQSVTVTPATVAGGAPTQALTPGTITSGISLHSVAKALSNNMVMLEESIEVSTLDALTTFGQVTSGQIQLAEQSKVSFIPTITMKSGETLLIAGMEDLEAKVNQNGIGSAENAFAVGATGNRSGTSTKKSFVILVTPYLM